MNPYQELERAGAILNGHFVYASDRHGSRYLLKDALYTNPDDVNMIGMRIAKWMVGRDTKIDVVIVPAIGAVNLGKAVVEQLRRETGLPVLVAFAEQDQNAILKVREQTEIEYLILGTDGQRRKIAMPAGAELIVKLPQMVIKRGYDKLVSGGKKVLVVEDVITTGQTVKRTIAAVRKHGGDVIGVCAIANRGKTTADTLGVPFLHSEVQLHWEDEHPDVCSLCERGVPIDTTPGHGKEFLAEKAARAVKV